MIPTSSSLSSLHLEDEVDTVGDKEHNLQRPEPSNECCSCAVCLTVIVLRIRGLQAERGKFAHGVEPEYPRCNDSSKVHGAD